jgi:CRP/FNR family transcriptional regulator, cyclic AMP receptor protein
MTVRTSFDKELGKKILKEVPIFASLSDDELASMIDKTNAYSCRKGETIFLEEDGNQLMYVIIRGRVKIVEITPDGQERVMAFRHRGECFGDMGLLDGRTDFALVIATEQSKMLLITKPLFDEYFLQNNRALQGVIAVLCGRQRESWMFQAIIGMNDAESRIRATLSRYGNTLGVRDSDGVIINAIFSHQSIADRVRISRETTSRVLMKMRDQGEIEILDGRRIKLLPTFYKKFAQSDICMALAGQEDVP